MGPLLRAPARLSREGRGSDLPLPRGERSALPTAYHEDTNAVSFVFLRDLHGGWGVGPPLWSSVTSVVDEVCLCTKAPSSELGLVAQRSEEGAQVILGLLARLGLDAVFLRGELELAEHLLVQAV